MTHQSPLHGQPFAGPGKAVMKATDERLSCDLYFYNEGSFWQGECVGGRSVWQLSLLQLREADSEFIVMRSVI
jgi:hypothetical protein